MGLLPVICVQSHVSIFTARIVIHVENQSTYSCEGAMCRMVGPMLIPLTTKILPL